MDEQLPNDIILAYLEYPGGRKQVGRLQLNNGILHCLEDYYGLLGHIPEGPFTQVTASIIDGTGAPLRLVSENAILNGLHLDLVPVKKLDPYTPQDYSPSSEIPSKMVYNYVRAGMNKPVILESSADQFLFDGHQLSPQEIQIVLNNIQNGVATLTHRLEKSDALDVLSKADRIEDHLKYIDKLAAQTNNPELKERARKLRSHIYSDTMVNGMGNKKAWGDIKNKRGAFGSLDINDFKFFNDKFGHDVGDEAIKAVGNAMISASKKMPKKIKLARNGGDEFGVYAKNPEDLHEFARHLRGEMDKIPAYNGQHRLSASLGISHSWQTADAHALPLAKEKKKGLDMATRPGLLVHSHFSPGAEIGGVKELPAEPKIGPAVEPPKPAPMSPAQPTASPAISKEPRLSKTEQALKLSEAAVNFRRAGLDVDFDPAVLSEIGITVKGKID